MSNDIFSRLADAGFGDDLVPLAPPDGAISTKARKIAKDKLGKVPCKLLTDGWCGFKDWQTHIATDVDFHTWGTWPDVGAGLICRRVTVFDIDVKDAALADMIEARITRMLGTAPCRVGQAPKRLLVYRLADGEPCIDKAVLRFTDPAGNAHVVEILGVKQQFVIAGIHPKTKLPYTWPRALGTFAKLPPVTIAGLGGCLATVANELEIFGCTITARATVAAVGEKIAAAPAAPAGPVGVTPRQMERLREYARFHAPACVGPGGEPKTFAVAAYLLGKWDDIEGVFAIMRDALGDEWEDDDLRTKVENAHEHRQRPAGSETDGWQPEPTFVDQTVKTIDGRNTRSPGPEIAPVNTIDGSDDYYALQFVDRNRDRFRFVADAGSGTWMRFDGTHWKRDKVLTVWDGIRTMHREMAADTKNTAEAKKLLSATTVSNVERHAKRDLRIATTQDQWDTDPAILVTPAGILDLRTGALRNATPADLVSRCTAAAPDANCPTPLWSKFLDRVTGGDRELQGYLQRLGGYALMGDAPEHCFQFFYGEGRNGKGVFLNTLCGLMGDYALAASAATFIITRGDQHPTGMASLRGKRLVIVPEINEGATLNVSFIKALTGGDKIQTRLMRQDFDEGTGLNPTLMLYGNYHPKLGTVDIAIAERVQMVPFNVYITPSERDMHLGEKLRAEWPGILWWMGQGCRAWQRERLGMPAAVRAATAAYLAEQDAISEWFGERCERDPFLADTSARLYADYRAWMQAEYGAQPKAQRAWALWMQKQKGVAAARSMSERGFTGVALKAPLDHPNVAAGAAADIFGI